MYKPSYFSASSSDPGQDLVVDREDSFGYQPGPDTETQGTTRREVSQSPSQILHNHPGSPLL